MKKDDYKNDFEKERKEIDLLDEQAPLSRADYHGRRERKGSRFSLVNILLVVFTLIPISIFAFVIISMYSSKGPITPKAEDEDIHFQKNEEPDNVLVDKEDKEKEELAKAEEQRKKEEKYKKEEEERKKELEKQKEEKKAEEERKKAEEKQKGEERKKEEERKKAEAEAAKKAEEEKKKQEQAQAQQRVHTVAPGETLYRISVNYYQHGDGVDKIKQANGLTSNDISVGQKLVIP